MLPSYGREEILRANRRTSTNRSDKKNEKEARSSMTSFITCNHAKWLEGRFRPVIRKTDECSFQRRHGLNVFSSPSISGAYHEPQQEGWRSKSSLRGLAFFTFPRLWTGATFAFFFHLVKSNNHRAVVDGKSSHSFIHVRTAGGYMWERSNKKIEFHSR
jgi:hypothetical protein